MLSTIMKLVLFQGSCNVTLALTSEACYKGLPKTATGEVLQFKGWPKLYWFITEHLRSASTTQGVESPAKVDRSCIIF